MDIVELFWSPESQVIVSAIFVVWSQDLANKEVAFHALKTRLALVNITLLET